MTGNVWILLHPDFAACQFDKHELFRWRILSDTSELRTHSRNYVGVRDRGNQRARGAVLWLAAGDVCLVPVSSGSCAVRAVRRSSPHGYHLPFNNVRAIRVLHGFKSHPDNQAQPAGLILTPAGTPIRFFSFKQSNPICSCHPSDLAARRQIRSDANPTHERAGIIYELWERTDHGARSSPPASGDALVEIDLCSSTFPPGRSGAVLLGGILQRVRPQKAPLLKSLTQKKKKKKSLSL